MDFCGFLEAKKKSKGAGSLIKCILSSLFNIHQSLHSLAISKNKQVAKAHPEFGSLVNPITTRRADYAHHITTSPPGFENPAASLLLHEVFKSMSSLSRLQNSQNLDLKVILKRPV